MSPVGGVVGDPTIIKSLSWGVTFSIALHALWIPLCGWLTGRYVDLKLVLYLVSGGYSSNSLLIEAAESFAGNLIPIAGYVLSTFMVGIISGWLLRKTVLKFDLDIKFGLLRFNNDWHYLLSGIKPNKPHPAGSIVAATVEFPDATYLYAGLLWNYTVSTDGRLREMTLIGARRRMITADQATDDVDGGDTDNGGILGARYYPLKGDLFVLDCSRVQTINIDYFFTDDAIDTEGDEDYMDLDEIEITVGGEQVIDLN